MQCKVSNHSLRNSPQGGFSDRISIRILAVWSLCVVLGDRITKNTWSDHMWTGPIHCSPWGSQHLAWQQPPIGVSEWQSIVKCFDKYHEGAGNATCSKCCQFTIDYTRPEYPVIWIRKMLLSQLLYIYWSQLVITNSVKVRLLQPTNLSEPEGYFTGTKSNESTAVWYTIVR